MSPRCFPIRFDWLKFAAIVLVIALGHTVQGSRPIRPQDASEDWVTTDFPYGGLIFEIQNPKVDSQSRQASCGAVLIKWRDDTKKDTFKVDKNHYQSKGCDTTFDAENFKSCKHNCSHDRGPRVHSEIAFLQELTGLEAPVNATKIQIESEEFFLKDIRHLEILIKNSSLPPCATKQWRYQDGKYVENTDKGTSCRKYIQQFCNDLHKKQGVTCTVYIGSRPNAYSNYTWLKCSSSS